MNIDYSQFYRGTANIPSYGNGAYQKDTMVKYEFNTTDEHGNKVMDKMSREETLQAMKNISSQYGDAVIVEFSGDGMAALVESGKAAVDASITQEQQEAMEARNQAFQKEITQIDKSIETGSNLAQTTNALDMMRTMDSSAYAEYQKIGDESSNEDRQIHELKYLTNWYVNAVKKNPSMIADYENSKKVAEPEGKPARNEEKCTTNTDNVDKEIEKLKEEKKQLEQQIKAAAGDAEEVDELKKKLVSIERELSQKDNDTYRRQNAVIS